MNNPKLATAIGAGLLLLAAALSHAQTSERPAFPRSTKLELAAMGASFAADGYTSYFLSQRYSKEYNPIARPFVKSPGGTVAYFGATYAGMVFLNYKLRNHERARHIMNWTVTAWETGLAARNFSVRQYSSCSAVWVQQGIIVPPCRHQ